MRKYLSIILMLVCSLGYVGFTQILFPSKYDMFDEVYSADTILLNKEKATNKTEFVNPYEKKGKYYIEIITTDTMTLKMSGDVIDINGVKTSSDDLRIEIKGSNILIESNTPIELSGYSDMIRYLDVNTEQVSNKLIITIGSLVGIVVVLLIFRSQLEPKAKITITLIASTILVFVLAQILNDMFWVLVSANVGWLSGLALEKIPIKKT